MIFSTMWTKIIPNTRGVTTHPTIRRVNHFRVSSHPVIFSVSLDIASINLDLSPPLLIYSPVRNAAV